MKQDVQDRDTIYQPLNGKTFEIEQEHGITAFYAGGPGEPYYQPVLECSCGFSSYRCDSWEDAGSAIDAHLKSC